MIRDVLLGIDLGTSSVKVVVVDPSLGICGEGRGIYETYTPQSNWAEQYAEDWWSATCQATRQAIDMAEQERPCNVVGLGLTGQMHSFVLIDKSGKPLRPAITWLDSRASGLVEEVQRKIAAEHLTHVIANESSASLTLVQLLWLLRNEPDVVTQGTALLMAKDYVRYRMTGEIGADVTDASATMMMNIVERTWLGPELEALFGIPQQLLPTLHNSYNPAGSIQPTVASVFAGQGQKEPPVVAFGSGDQQAAALANGIIHPGMIQVMMGTGGQIATPIEEIPATPKRSLNYFCHHQDWIAQGSLQNAGSALGWAMNVLNANWEDVERAAHKQNIEACPTFIPYLTGERTPVMDSQASGAWMGLRNSMTKEDLLYAVVEGVIFSFTDALKEVSPTFDHIRLGGGGSQSRGYTQLLSNSIGSPLHRMPSGNTSALGAAILGGIASHVFGSLSEGTQRVGLQPGEVVEPDMHQHTLLTRRYQLFQEVRARGAQLKTGAL